MPYVTEQLQFNLNKIHEEANNQATLRQPAPLVLSQYGKDYLSSVASMEMAVTLAKRDIRLRNIPKHDDLDTIPVKEISKPHKFKTVPKIPIRKEIPCQLRVDTAPVNPIPKQTKNTHIVCMPTTEPVITTNYSNTQTERNSVIIMMEALTNTKNRLARPNYKKKRHSSQFFPDPIEEARLTRRAEEQRRHLYRVLYNAKRHTVQLVTFLERTAFKHRHTVLKQSSIMCHLLAAHRSLMSALSSFVKGADMLKSAFMQDLKKKVGGEVEVLLEEFEKVANLLDIKSQTLAPQPEPSTSDQENSVPQLKILDIRKSHKDPPLSPERDESLRAAVRSLVKTALIKRNATPPPHGPELEADPSKPQQKTFRMNKDMPNSTSSKKGSTIKPKSNIRKSITKKKRPTTAVSSSHKMRSLGNIKRSHLAEIERPCSAPLLGNDRYVSQCDMPLMIRGGQLTPYITERELARQAWLDKLTEEQPSITEDLSPDSGLLKNYGSREDLEPEYTSISPKKFSKQSAFKAASDGAEMSTTMVQLLDKLEEIEKEEEEIRNRWLHIQYSDPYQSDKECGPVVLPSAELLASSSALLDVGPSIYSEVCKDTGPANISLSPDSIKSIESYRKATERHIALTRHIKTADFDPWATINMMVDNLVEKLVSDVCGELLQTCDGLAENLYMAEFLPAEDQSEARINVT